MATKYAGFVVDSPSEIERWINNTGETTLFALVDFQALSVKQKGDFVSVLGNTAINLYDDLSGTRIAEAGPRLMVVGTESRAAVLELLFDGYPLSLLTGTCSLSELETHLRSIREVMVPDDTHALFRFQDGKVTQALFPVISPEQGGLVLGPLLGWYVLDACRKCHTLLSSDRKNKSGQLRFDKRLVSALDARLFVHTVAAQIRDTDSTLLNGLSPCEIESQIQQRLEKGESFGLDLRADLSLYCVLSFQFPEGFERMPPFSEALRYRENGKESFGMALDQVSSEVWDEWDARLAMEETK